MLRIVRISRDQMLRIVRISRDQMLRITKISRDKAMIHHDLHGPDATNRQGIRISNIRTPLKSGVPEMLAVPAPYVTPVVLQLNDMNII